MKHAALIVIDVQCGAFDGQRSPPIDRPEGLISNTLELIKAARASRSPVVFVQHCDGPHEPGGPFEPGTPHWQLHPALAPEPSDLRISKYVCNAFENTGLNDHLQSLGIEHLFLCGLQSEYCIRETSLAGVKLDYKVHLAEDAHGTISSANSPASEISNRVNQEVQSHGVTLTPTAALATLLHGA